MLTRFFLGGVFFWNSSSQIAGAKGAIQKRWSRECRQNRGQGLEEVNDERKTQAKVPKSRKAKFRVGSGVGMYKATTQWFRRFCGGNRLFSNGPQ
jgi:hypothetical protein